MIAILEDAIRCLAGSAYGTSYANRQKLAVEARKWIAEKDDEHAFSFETVCYVLGLTPECVRKCLREKTMV